MSVHVVEHPLVHDALVTLRDARTPPEEFRRMKEIGMAMGFKHVESGPLVRSSYHAWEQVQAAEANR